MSPFRFFGIAIFFLSVTLGPSLASGQIQQSVGKGGVNRAEDVRRVQHWLNQVSDVSGGPETRLTEDGRMGGKTLAAISRFQNIQLGFSDGRIDPGQHSELRLLRINGIHEVLGKADSPEEKALAKFTTEFSVISVTVNGKSVAVRPPYHINAGKRKAAAESNRGADPAVQGLIKKTLLSLEGVVGKAKPEQIRDFLQAAIDTGLIETQTPDGMRDFLAKYGISTDCSDWLRELVICSNQ